VSTIVVVSLAIAGAAFCGLLFCAGYLVGSTHANSLWVFKSSVRGGLRKECDGQLYYVARCDDPEACARLRDGIEAEQERRESAEYSRRIQGWR
jgi:hypothetical protein